MREGCRKDLQRGSGHRRAQAARLRIARGEEEQMGPRQSEGSEEEEAARRRGQAVATLLWFERAVQNKECTQLKKSKRFLKNTKN